MTFFEVLKNAKDIETAAKILWFISPDDIYTLKKMLKGRAPVNIDEMFEEANEQLEAGR